MKKRITFQVSQETYQRMVLAAQMEGLTLNDWIIERVEGNLPPLPKIPMNWVHQLLRED